MAPNLIRHNTAPLMQTHDYSRELADVLPHLANRFGTRDTDMDESATIDAMDTPHRKCIPTAVQVLADTARALAGTGKVRYLWRKREIRTVNMLPVYDAYGFVVTQPCMMDTPTLVVRGSLRQRLDVPLDSDAPEAVKTGAWNIYSPRILDKARSPYLRNTSKLDIATRLVRAFAHPPAPYEQLTFYVDHVLSPIGGDVQRNLNNVRQHIVETLLGARVWRWDEDVPSLLDMPIELFSQFPTQTQDLVRQYQAAPFERFLLCLSHPTEGQRLYNPAGDAFDGCGIDTFPGPVVSRLSMLMSAPSGMYYRSIGVKLSDYAYAVCMRPDEVDAAWNI